MTLVIHVEHRPELSNRPMTPIDDDPQALSVSRGTGDFQHRDTYAEAKVEIREGRVACVEFMDDRGAQIAGAGALRRLLEGQPLSKALEVTPDAVEDTGATDLPEHLCIVLIEAFHRAVESCFEAE